ncbi:alpha/beta fold hydrolase [Frigoribacterium sp. CG_9.8]|uniref:alpha/beta hydrolase family protein n=1 Tax=Frigoribacterium sp. CG_9.8 TaxID=2787733 RepID=UPI0018C97E74|nr:alpha-beta hydrolase superfamily lysophospholipase [Frigoribacterium sp. CG_9.8]
MADSRRHAVKAIPSAPAILATIAAVAAVTAITVAAVTLQVARSVVTPPKRRPEDTRILAVDGAGETITLIATADARLPGEYGFFFGEGSGHARVGGIVAQTQHTVIRRLLGVDRGVLTRARRGRFSGWFYTGPADLGFPFENVEIATELGPAPAWLVPPEEPSTRWVIEVHGRAVRREETVRAVPVFRAAGYCSLLISYRNDEDAPASLDGRYGLGDTEWHDVDAAIRYAVEHGATDIVLMGWSMGGATVLQAATRAEFAGVVRGIVLDSPVIDWVTALRFHGKRLGLPNLICSAAIALLSMKWAGSLTGQRAPIDLAQLDFVRRSADLQLPILLMHSDDDGFIPATASLALSAARPDIVTYVKFTVAGHTKLWNYDRERWNDAISCWLATELA